MLTDVRNPSEKQQESNQDNGHRMKKNQMDIESNQDNGHRITNYMR